MSCRVFRKYTPESILELVFDDVDIGGEGYAQSRIVEGPGHGKVGTYLWHISEVLPGAVGHGYHEITDLDAFARVAFDEEETAKAKRQVELEEQLLKGRIFTKPS